MSGPILVLEKGKKSHGARSGEYGGCGKMVTFSYFRNCFIYVISVLFCYALMHVC